MREREKILRVKALTFPDKRKCKVLLEEGFAFVLYRREAETYHLEEDAVLEDGVYREILEEILIPRARERALHLLQYQGRTCSQMQQRLKEDGYPDEAIKRVMAFLEEYRFLDDSSYIENYIQIHRRRKSRRQIAYELTQKGIDPSQLRQALDENPIDEEETARELLARKLKGKPISTYEEKCRAAAFLQRKGFSGEVVRRVVMSAQTDS